MMAGPVNIQDSHTGNTARVSRFGQLITAPLAYSEPVQQNLNIIDTAFNFLEPETGKSIVITDIIVSADKSVSVTDPAEIEIYESDEIDSLNIVQGIVSPRLLRGGDFNVTGLNLLVPEGRWVNATTSDNNILITIMFYRIPVETV